MNKCSKPECNAVGNSCLEGKHDPKDCEHYQPMESNESEIANYNGQNLPWSGNGLGSLDLEVLKAKNKKIMIGIIGSHDTGKTTFLMMLYLQLMKGADLGKFAFSNSTTLSRWEVLASWGREHNYLTATFPPHTSRNSIGEPSLLHLGIRDNLENYVDILMTDAPGEWFSTWAISEESLNAEGANWIINNSDAYILIADCEKLSGTERGSTKRELLDLVTRLSTHVKNKPFLLLWTKTDIIKKVDLAPTIVETIKDRLKTFIPHAIECEINKADKVSVTHAMKTLMEEFERNQYIADISKTIFDYESPFYSYKKQFN